VGGFTGLMGAKLAGPRLGRFDPVTGAVNDMPEHNIAFMALGVGMLWFGWYGFNCGSVLDFVHAGELAGKVAVNTTIAAASGCIVGVFVSYHFENIFSVSVALNGILAGLVSITAPCAVVTPWMAFLIGGIGSSIHYAFRRILFKLRIDDPLDAAPIHGFAGIWGLLSVGIFCTDDAVQYAGYPNVNNACGSGRQFATQVIGSLIILCWTVTMSTIVWIICEFTIGLRVPAVLEEMGMDVMQHGNTAYGDRKATLGWQLEAGGGGMPYEDGPVRRDASFDPYKPKRLLSGPAGQPAGPPHGGQPVPQYAPGQQVVRGYPGGQDLSSHGIPVHIVQDVSVHGSGLFAPHGGPQRIPSSHHPQHPSAAHVPFLSQTEIAQQPYSIAPQPPHHHVPPVHPQQMAHVPYGGGGGGAVAN